MFVFIFTRCWRLRQDPGKYFSGPGKSCNLFSARQLNPANSHELDKANAL